MTSTHTTGGSLFLLLFVSGPHLALLRNYSWQCMKDLIGCQGSNLVGNIQGKCPTHYTKALTLAAHTLMWFNLHTLLKIQILLTYQTQYISQSSGIYPRDIRMLQYSQINDYGILQKLNKKINNWSSLGKEKAFNKI